MKKLTFVCSPYRGEVKRNIGYATELTKIALDLNLLPITPHLYITQVLNDDIEEERKQGQNISIELLKKCEVMIVGSKYGISEGMEAEIKIAKERDILILNVYF